MEGILQDINRLISMSDAEIRRTRIILDSVLQTFIENMKMDPLFNAMFKRVFYGGSFYDGLKVCAPDEFDLDLLLKLPKCAKPTLTTSDIPGFVHLQLEDMGTFLKSPEGRSDAYRNFEKLLDERRYLNTQKVLGWMESVVIKALNRLPVRGYTRILVNENDDIFEITIHKGGPALTLRIRGAEIKMDVDLVACFVFGSDMWPKNGFRANPVPYKPEFFIVPKIPKAPGGQPILHYWRLSFQEQERVLINDMERLKPTVRLLKKLRDTWNHPIASYYIKTVILHLVDEKVYTFWDYSLSYVFMDVLKEYKAYINNKKIPYYWNKKNNLLGEMDPRTLDNISDHLGHIIRNMENNLETIPQYFGYRKEAMGGGYIEAEENISGWCTLS